MELAFLKNRSQSVVVDGVSSAQVKVESGVPQDTVFRPMLFLLHINDPWGKGTGSPSNTKSPGLRPTSIPTDILIHAAIWPQQIWAENWGLCPFGGGGARSPPNTMWPGRGLPACQVSSWSVQPFGHNTPTLQTDRQTGQTDNGPIA